MGAPKNCLEDIFQQTLIDFDWDHYGLGEVDNTPAAPWSRDLAVNLAWHVRNRLKHVDSYRAEIL
jgi:hypothetical protein